MLVNMRTMLADAKQKKYGVPAANVWNEDSIQAAILTAEQYRSPLILAFYPAMVDILEVGKLAVERAGRASVPVAVHLDHGQEFADAVKAVRAGFTSIMVDRSTCPFDQNVAEVKEIVKFAHAIDITVEAELGHVGKGAEYEQTKHAGLTDPLEALRFVQETKVDCLAVAVGTSHGLYAGRPELQFERLAAIQRIVSVPLVLHGCSGTGDENLKQAIELGITKLNLYTDLDQAGHAALTQFLVPGKGSNMMEIESVMLSGYGQKLGHYMQLFGSVKRA